MAKKINYGTFSMSGPCPYPSREWSKEECLADGMSEKEYEIQKALGSLPEKHDFLEGMARAHFNILKGINAVTKVFTLHKK